MRQFTVPQFIDIEDKVFGPITGRQFVEIMAEGLLLFLAWQFTSAIVSFLVILILTLPLTLVLAFVKINGRPFHYFVLNILQTAKNPWLRVWNHKRIQIMDEEKEAHDKTDAGRVISRPRPYSGSRLNELSLIVDTQGLYRGGDTAEGREIKNLEEPRELWH